jgi:hypothetical protein
VRAETIILRLGLLGDVLVPIAVDSTDTEQRLRRLFSNWIDDSVSSQLLDVTPALAIHLGGGATSARGPRTAPHLRRSQDVLARSDNAIDVLHQLAFILGGIHDQGRAAPPGPPRLRLFTCGESVVLADVDPPHLTADRALAAHGIHERCQWGVHLDPGNQTVEVPPPLAGNWGHTDMHPPDETTRWLLAGIVLWHHDEDLGAAFAHSLRRNGRSSWLQSLQRADEFGMLSIAYNRASLRQGVRQLLLS